MKVAVIGSGVTGVASAYYLARYGHEVTVYDRKPSPGQGASFANAGQVSWGHASPCAAPGIPLKALRWLFEEHAPLIIRFRTDPALWRWLAAMLRECTASRYALKKARMLRVARYSQACLAELRDETGVRYDDRQLGTIQLFRTRAAVDRAAADVEILRRHDIPHRLLDRDACLAIEPGLASAANRIAGGLHLPGDETGDCHQFTVRLARVLEQRGVRFRTKAFVDRLVRCGDRIGGIVVSSHLETADAYLLAGGVWSLALVAPLGLRLPVHPVKGYSMTVEIVDPGCAPVSTVMDEAHKVAVTRLGDRIRAAGIAELAGFDASMDPARCRTVRHVVEDLFPRDQGCGDQLLGGAAADDARRNPGRRRHAVSQPVPEHRPRHARLDHGLRLGSHRRRPHVGPAARDRGGRPVPGPVLARRADGARGGVQRAWFRCGLS